MKFWQLLVFGLVIVAGGCLWLANIPAADKCEQLPVSSIYADRDLASPWVSIQGRLVWSKAVYDGTEYSGTYYVPMVPAGWTERDPVKLLVVVSSHRSDDWTNFEDVEGVVDGRLPSSVSKFFATEGPALAESLVVLNADARPGQGQRAAHVAIALGAVLVVLSLCFYGSESESPPATNPSVGRMLTLGPRAADLAELRGEISPDDPQIVEREQEVERWMREHGLAVVNEDADGDGDEADADDGCEAPASASLPAIGR